MISQVFNKKILLTCFILVFSCKTFAEYRAYQYYVKSSTYDPTDTQAYQVISTLDPVSYIAYHGGSNAVRVDLVRTWMCPGHTGNRKPICPAPDDLSTNIEEESLNWNTNGN